MFALRNLDTGEVRPLLVKGACDAQCTSFLGRPSSPGGLRAGHSYWREWWNEKRQHDRTLWQAAEAGSVQKLRDVLATSTDGGPPVDINARSVDGRTALHVATSIGQRDCVELLLDAGASVDARTDAGLTALHVACQRGHSEVASLLLVKNSAQCCVVDAAGNSPLHIAAANGHKELVLLLLEHSSSEQLRTRNDIGQRPGEMARDIEIARIFQRQSQDVCDDSYAGRTLCARIVGGDVVLRNARSDVVRRLMHRAKSVPARDAPCVEDDEEDMTSTSSHGIYDTTPRLQRAPARTASKGSLNSGLQDATSHSQRTSARTASRRFVTLQSTSGIEEVGPDSFNFVKLLGGGSFGRVFLVTHKQTNRDYAMKILDKTKATQGKVMRYTQTERNVLSYLRHPYIVSLHYAFQTPKHLVLVLQFCPGGDLQKKINEERRIDEQRTCLFSAEILTAIVHLHERLIIYRDLKPENVLLDADGHCMLCDFGLSKEDVCNDTRSFCGSLAFLAPEIITNKGHNQTVDIYGLGVLLFAMLTGRPPFYDRNKDKLLSNIQHVRLSLPNFVSQAASSLMQTLLDRTPSRRLGATRTADIQSHPFYSSLDFDALMRREILVPTSSFETTASQVRFTLEKPADDNTLNPFSFAGGGSGRRRGRLRAALLAYLTGKRSGSCDNTQCRVPGWEFSGFYERSIAAVC
jgi:serine/threonine protein kinase